MELINKKESGLSRRLRGVVEQRFDELQEAKGEINEEQKGSSD